MDTLTNFWSNLFSLNGDKFLLITSYSLMFHQQVDKKKKQNKASGPVHPRYRCTHFIFEKNQESKKIRIKVQQ